MKSTTIFIAIVAIVACLGLVTNAQIDEEAFYNALKTRSLTPPTQQSLTASQGQALCPATTRLDNAIDAQFTLENANIFARLSSAAYCAPPATKQGKKALDNWTCTACRDTGLTMTKVTPFHIVLTDLYGYIAYNPTANTVVLAFTGSVSIVNWLYNLDATFIDYPGVANAQVHQGFFNAWMRSRPTIIAMLDAYFYDHPTATLAITGHSLGGAVATLATFDLATAKSFQIYNNFGPTPIVIGQNMFDEVSIPEGLLGKSDSKFTSKYKLGGSTYTYGAPRVGNDIFSNYFVALLGKTQIYRVTHRQDPVPHVPPLLLWKTAQHVTTEVYYNTSAAAMGDFTICPEAETKQCSNQWMLPVEINDHLNYMNYHLGTQADSAC